MRTDRRSTIFRLSIAPEPPPETEDVERPEGEDDPALYEPVLEALKTVRDPEIPVNFVDLGLIYELASSRAASSMSR